MVTEEELAFIDIVTSLHSVLLGPQNKNEIIM
jgi:hypothetical protein